MPQYFNPGTSPIVYDEDGRSAGGGEWFDTKATDRIQRLINEGYIVEVKNQEPEPKPRAAKKTGTETKESESE